MHFGCIQDMDYAIYCKTGRHSLAQMHVRREKIY
jgi:hypothetical protein